MTLASITQIYLLCNTESVLKHTGIVVENGGTTKEYYYGPGQKRAVEKEYIQSSKVLIPLFMSSFKPKEICAMLTGPVVEYNIEYVCWDWTFQMLYNISVQDTPGISCLNNEIIAVSKQWHSGKISKNVVTSFLNGLRNVYLAI